MLGDVQKREAFIKILEVNKFSNSTILYKTTLTEIKLERSKLYLT